MSLDLNIKTTNDNLEKDGVWLDWPLIDGASVKIRRSNKDAQQEKLAHRQKQNRKSLRLPKEYRKVYIQFLANDIIADWKGFENKGKDFKFSTKNAVTALEEYEDLYHWVTKMADNLENFIPEDDTTREERAEELKK